MSEGDRWVSSGQGGREEGVWRRGGVTGVGGGGHVMKALVVGKTVFLFMQSKKHEEEENRDQSLVKKVY